MGLATRFELDLQRDLNETCDNLNETYNNLNVICNEDFNPHI